MASSPSPPDTRATKPRDRRWLAPIAVLLALAVSGCDNAHTPDLPEANTTTLVVSEVWRAGAADEEGATRIASLQRSINQLREETGTGWIGRQDDVTGYLADLSGGSRVGPPEEFMDAYGPALFGVDSGVLDLERPDTETVPGMVSTRAGQTVGAVPVRDAFLLFTSHAGAVPSADRLSGVHGRVFPGLSVGTEPQVAARDAALVAAEASQGGSVRGRTTLVVIPAGEGQLAWQVTIVGGAAGGFASALYYVDALTGTVVDVRPTTVESHAEPDPNSVEVTGMDPIGQVRTGHGLRTPEGIAMTDTTTPAWDASARTGDVSIYDASGIRGDNELPGKLVVSPGPDIGDPDVIAAQAYGRSVLDYYGGFGRRSWDNKGSSLVMAVHYGPPEFCNAFFSAGLMVFGNPCVNGGRQESNSVVDVDIVGHEVTHGVNASSARLVYSGQSGALDESFADYFGNVIGNRLKGTENDTYAEDTCRGRQPTGYWCDANPDGSTSQRYLPNGNGLDDYARLLNLGPRLVVTLGTNQDNGGVHSNSAIWNNALWTIRTQLAKIDNLPGNESPLAQSFDRAVYGVLASRLGPTSGFLDARAALEQVIIDSGLDPVVLRVAREVFDANNFCAECNPPGDVAGDTISSAPQSQLHPAISGDRVAWLDLGATNWGGQAATTQVGEEAVSLGTATDVLELGFAGEALITLHERGELVRTDASGAATILARVNPYTTLAAGLAGSDAGAAWASAPDTVMFVDHNGAMTETRIPGISGDPITAVATGGGHVAVATLGGKVLGWRPGEEVRRLGRTSSPSITLAAHSGRVLVVEESRRAKLFEPDGRVFNLSTSALPFGAALGDEFAAWTEVTGSYSPEVLSGGGTVDTDIYVLSLASGNVYNIVAGDSQQGFPALSGRRLVWQDSVLGSDDIRTLELPTGL